VSRRTAVEKEAEEPAGRATDQAPGSPWLVRRLGGYVLVHKRNLVIAFAGAIAAALPR